MTFLSFTVSQILESNQSFIVINLSHLLHWLPFTDPVYMTIKIPSWRNQIMRVIA